EGFAVGVISKFYESTQDGIVVQAVGATLATVLVMLVLYRTQIIKVTDRFRRIVIGATAGVMLLYLVSLVIRLFAGPGSISFLSSPSALGIGFSVFVCVLAAMNLALDFDFIERGSANRLPKGMEWYAAFGLLVTIVWLYLEILRLLSKLNRR
ncbi:MAG: Bax inhibitor-1/YccA family protein, partial [Actinobacteria bacterium]|nr:Bax inhibitor-1/YccA family protein [Actinomycetota bacterium]